MSASVGSRRAGGVAGPAGRGGRPRGRRRGVTPAEVLVVIGVVGVVVLILLLVLPRQRETARKATCQRNLMQIGVALVLYEGSEGRLPVVPVPGATPPPQGGPLKSLLESLVLPDLTGLTDPRTRPRPRPGAVPGERPVPGFVCPSDPGVFSTRVLRAPVSYRATTGDDPQGTNGGFAPGRSLRLSTIEEGDGLGFTAAFSERLVGRGQSQGGSPHVADYRVVRGPLSATGCPATDPTPPHADAGYSWAEASWRSTLYNHTLPPNGGPSCVTRDGRSARMGASGGHVGGVNVLLFDGHVRVVTAGVARPVWEALATTRTPGPPPTTLPEPGKETR